MQKVNLFNTIEDDWLTNQAWVSVNEKPTPCNESEISRFYGTQVRGPNFPREDNNDPRSFNYDIQLCDVETSKFNCSNLLPNGDPNKDICETSKEGNTRIQVSDRIVPQSSTIQVKLLLSLDMIPAEFSI